MCLFCAKENEARHRLNLRVILNANSRLSNSANDKIFINSIHVFSVSLRDIQQNSSPMIHSNNNKNLPLHLLLSDLLLKQQL